MGQQIPSERWQYKRRVRSEVEEQKRFLVTIVFALLAVGGAAYFAVAPHPVVAHLKLP